MTERIVGEQRQRIAVISAYWHTSQFIAGELTELLAPKQELCLFSLETEVGVPRQELPAFDGKEYALVIYSSEAVRRAVEAGGVRGGTEVRDGKETAKGSGVPAVVTRRNIEMTRLPELISIESGTEVSAFGSSREASLELIEELKQVGVNHLRLRPYYPGAAMVSSGIVVTPGKFLPQMAQAKRVIDVEFRTLSISTVMEIFMALGLSAEKLAGIEEWYQKELRGINRYHTVINKSITGILEVINEGIFCTEESGRVLFCNKTFLNLTGTEYYDVIGKDYREIPFGPELSAMIRYDGDLYSELIDYRDRKLLVNRQKNEGEDSGFILNIQDVTRIQELETDVRKKLSRKGFVAKYTLDKLIGKSPLIRGKIQEVYKIAASDYTVLLTGDNGTGKEMFAQAIHNQSVRARYPFVAVNLASLSDSIIESEIFGYEEGAFTGALKGGKPGLFEMAHNGTIFIDEIGDVSPHIQQRLLRVLQEREVMRVGGNRIIPVDVRVIAATNRNLFQMVREGRFRMDLYYRLKVLHIHIPPLSQRAEDIPLFLEHFFREVGSGKRLNDQAMELLFRYPWPGNVRELQNLVYYLETLCDHQEIAPADLPEEFRTYGGGEPAGEQWLWEPVIAENGRKTAEELAYLLEQLHRAMQNGAVLGRNKLCRLSQSRPEGPLSPEQLRTRFEKLERYGLIKVGRTRQGSQITEKGETFLQSWKKEMTGKKGEHNE